MKGELAKTIIWPWADWKGKALGWFFFCTHVDSWSQVERKHDLDNLAKLRMIFLALPTVQSNSGTFHFLPSVSRMTRLQREWQKEDELQKSVVSGSDINCGDPRWLEALEPYFVSVTQISRSRMKGPWEYKLFCPTGREFEMEDAVI